MWRFILSLTATVGLVWLLNSPHQFGDLSLPPLGKFLSPSHGFWQNAENGKFVNTIQRFDEIERDVQIIFDSRMVPHIFASNDRDLYFAQGYVTAMHRLWQLDITARSSVGRVSEILGEGALAYDRSQREMGMAYGAEQTLELWKEDEESLAAMQAYADGVNAYISKLKPRDYPVEFKLINYEPEEWTTLKSAAFVMSMAKTLCSREFDLEFSQMRQALGEETFDFFFPEFNPSQDPIIPADTPWDFVPLDPGEPISANTDVPLGSVGDVIESISEYHVGSNNWAINGSRTASGKPILCNDPHLNLTLPSIWYEIQLKSNQQNCYGASLPGMPFVVSGFNEQSAWGMTNVGQDMLDWFTIDWTDESRMSYMLDGQETEVTTRIETYNIKGGDSVTDTVKYTVWGPVANGGDYDGMAMQWLPNLAIASSDPAAFRNLNLNESVDDFLAALDKYRAPAQNFVYANINNDIAMRIGGALPLRPKGQGRFVSDGSNSASGWNGYIPPAHNPVTVNPDRNFVSSANQKTTDESYPYYYTGGKYFEDYRGITLNRYLSATHNASAEDMRRLQQSNFSLKAEMALPLLLSAVDSFDLTADEQEIVAALKLWDYNYAADAKEPLMFDLWFGYMFRNTWDEIDSLDQSVNAVYPESWWTIKLAKHHPDTTVFDRISTAQDESFIDIALLALHKTADKLRSLDDGITWGAYRKTTVGHIGRLDAFDYEISKTSGHGDALNATSSGNGPSWRMVVELGEPMKAHVVYPGGQSGNPGSQFYDSMVEDWAAGNYYLAQFGRTPADIDGVYSITLQHKGK